MNCAAQMKVMERGNHTCLVGLTSTAPCRSDAADQEPGVLPYLHKGHGKGQPHLHFRV